MHTKQHQTSIGLLTGLVILYFVFAREELLWIAAAMGCIALVSDYYAGKIVDGLQAVMRAVGFVISRGLLTIVFFIVLVPLAALYRLFHHESPLRLRKKLAGTYYVIRNHEFSVRDFEKPW